MYDRLSELGVAPGHRRFDPREDTERQRLPRDRWQRCSPNLIAKSKLLDPAGERFAAQDRVEKACHGVLTFLQGSLAQTHFPCHFAERHCPSGRRRRQANALALHEYPGFRKWPVSPAAVRTHPPCPSLRCRPSLHAEPVALTHCEPSVGRHREPGPVTRSGSPPIWMILGMTGPVLADGCGVNTRFWAGGTMISDKNYVGSSASSKVTESQSG